MANFGHQKLEEFLYTLYFIIFHQKTGMIRLFCPIQGLIFHLGHECGENDRDGKGNEYDMFMLGVIQIRDHHRGRGGLSKSGHFRVGERGGTII